MNRYIPTIGGGTAGAILLVLSLNACSPAQSQNAQNVINTISADLPTATSAAQSAITYYPIAKGFILSAAAIDPSLAPTIMAGLAKLDPIVAKVGAAIAAGSADAPALITMATTINQQIATLSGVAAPVVQVVAGANAPPQ